MGETVAVAGTAPVVLEGGIGLWDLLEGRHCRLTCGVEQGTEPGGARPLARDDAAGRRGRVSALHELTFEETWEREGRMMM